MIEDAIRKVSEMAIQAEKPYELMFQGLPFSSKKLERIQQPEPETIVTSTLTSIVDYVSKNPGNELPESIVIHVSAFNTVSVCSSITGPWKQRFEYLKAVSFRCEFVFDRYYDFESFTIALQSFFQDAGDRAAILKMIGNLVDQNINTLADDGVTQVATVKTGVACVENSKVPNPVTLVPFRTFREIEQPASSYVFRLKSGVKSDNGPGCALFEADGEAWKLEAIEKVKKWLRERIDESIPIIA